MESGRFLSSDPLGHGSSMSLYDYANGDPVNNVDPDGRNALDDVAIGIQNVRQRVNYAVHTVNYAIGATAQTYNVAKADVLTPVYLGSALTNGALAYGSNKIGMNGLASTFQNNSRQALLNMTDLWSAANRGPLGPVVNNQIYNIVDRMGFLGQNNQQFLGDWLTGNLPTQINYSASFSMTVNGSTYKFGYPSQVYDMQNSAGADLMRANYNNGKFSTSYDTVPAFMGTVGNLQSTAFQVGGFANATVSDSGNGMATFTIPNVAGAQSFFYHLTPNLPDDYGGPMHSVTQTFTWDEPMSTGKTIQIDPTGKYYK